MKTGRNVLDTRERTDGAAIQCWDYQQLSERLENQETSLGLTKSVSMQLYQLMQMSLKRFETDPDAVKNVVSCASEIREMLRFEMDCRVAAAKLK